MATAGAMPESGSETSTPRDGRASPLLADAHTKVATKRGLVRVDTAAEGFGELVADKRTKRFKEDVERMRALVKKSRKRVFHPLTSRWLPVFDNAVGMCVLFVSVVSPVDITMGGRSSLTMVYLIGLVCNIVFFCDFLIKLNRVYREKRALGGRYVKDRRKILRNYLRGWLVVDLLSSIPFDLPFALGMADAGDFTRTMRLLNLIKLLRVFKLIETLPLMLAFLTQRRGWSNAGTEILKFGMLLLLMVHYLACLWAYTGLNWEATEGSTIMEGPGAEKSWIEAYHMEDYGMHRLYAVSTYVAIVAIFGGVSSVTPKNFAEYCVLTSMMFIGGMAWAYVLSMLCSIFSALNPQETAHKNMMDSLTHFMEDRAFEPHFKQRLRDFFTYTKDYAREVGYQNLFERMSSRLRADTALAIGEGDLAKVWYLRTEVCEKPYLCDVALHLTPSVHEIHERLPADRLTIIFRGIVAQVSACGLPSMLPSHRLMIAFSLYTIISRGLVAQSVKLLGAGCAIGVDCLVSDNHKNLKQLDPVVCLSFVQVTAADCLRSCLRSCLRTACSRVASSTRPRASLLGRSTRSRARASSR